MPKEGYGTNNQVKLNTRCQSDRQKEILAPEMTSPPPNRLKSTGNLKRPEITTNSDKLLKMMVKKCPPKSDLTTESRNTNSKHLAEERPVRRNDNLEGPDDNFDQEDEENQDVISTHDPLYPIEGAEDSKLEIYDKSIQAYSKEMLDAYPIS